MEERITLTTESEKLINGTLNREQFLLFFDSFKSGMNSVKEGFKKEVEPSIYFNNDSKKISKKSEQFSNLLDEIDRGIRIIENSLSDGVDLEKFKKGIKTISGTADKMEQFKKEVGALSGATTI